jgi:hypothetical protein
MDESEDLLHDALSPPGKSTGSSQHNDGLALETEHASRN